MTFDIFPYTRAAKGQRCDYDAYLRSTTDAHVVNIAKALQTETDPEKRSELKKNLPAITWQASFVDHQRKNANAIPSGLFMLDIDHTDDKTQEIIDKALGMISELGLVYIARSISGKGVRLVALCHKEFTTLEQCQKWLADKLGVEYDSACKDFARLSYCVPQEYVAYCANGIFNENALPWVRYEVNAEPQAHREVGQTSITEEFGEKEPTLGNTEPVQTDYHGLSLKDIAVEWLESTGGMPQKGERNQRLYNCAFQLKYICDFNEETLLAALPDCGLSVSERKQIVHSACGGPRSTCVMPKTLQTVIKKMESEKAAEAVFENEDDSMIETSIEKFADVFSTSEVPQLPPIWSHFYKIAPDDFKLATMLCLLPFLGTLASRLRARYRGREVHSPSFIVTLEAPQAQGKSFIKILDDICLGKLKEEDARQRQEEREWREYRKMVKDLGTKLTKKEAQDFMDSKPEVHIRYVAPTMSITELMRKMDAAKGLHLFAISTEIDTVYKAMKRDFSNFSDILRKAFDNDEIGQDYASDTSWSGIVRLYYNCIYSGTPKAVRRFYPDVEDGLVSRVLFVTIPDQSFKQTDVFGTFKTKELEDLKYHLERLNAVSVVDGEPQPEHMLKLDFLVRHMMKWVVAQQKYAQINDDVTRDTFCRRSAVIGFRAGMIAFYLWDEVTTPPMMRKVKNFATWIANCCLRQFLLRFKIEHDTRSTFKFRDVYDLLPDEFDYIRLRALLESMDVKTKPNDVIYRWKLGGRIEESGKGRSKTFKKVKE